MNRVPVPLLASALLMAAAFMAGAAPAPRTVRIALDPAQYRALAPAAQPASAGELTRGYAALVSARTGMRFQPWAAPSSTAALQAVCAQQADLMLLLGPLDHAPCRLAASRPFYRGQTLLALRRATAPLPLGRAAAHRVAVVGGSRYPAWLAAHYPQLQVIAVSDMPGALWAVENGIADAALGLDLVMRPLVRRRYADSLLLHNAPADMPGSLQLVARAADQALLDDIEAATGAITPQQHAQLLQHVTRSVHLDIPSAAVLLQHFHWELMAAGVAMSLLLASGLWLALTRYTAQRSERRQARFIGVMSHEVRNAAQAMVASVDLLDRSGLDHAQRQLVDAARAAGTGLRNLLGHALDYSRMAGGQFRPRPGWQDINALIHDCVAAIRPATDAKGVRLHLQLAPDPLPVLWTDAGALQQILSNLLGNAGKFTAAGSIEVCIWLHHQGDACQLRMTVSDTGIGIPAALHGRVFQPFAQAPATQPRDHGGSGLGLWICHGLVQALHGRVQLCSTPGKGSCFDITLPVAVQLPAMPAPRPLSGRSLLLVEDHAANRALVARQLEALGASVQTCSDGAGALRLQADHRSGMVLIDCGLADMSGYQLARALRELERRHALPAALLVALSAAGSQAHVQRCRDSGMDAVLFKPLDLAQLLAVAGISASAATPPPPPRADTLPLLHALQSELRAMQRAHAGRDDRQLRYHAHRASGLLRMLDQEDLAGCAADLHEMGLGGEGNHEEARRLLDGLQRAAARLVPPTVTSTAADNAATAHVPETRSVPDHGC